MQQMDIVGWQQASAGFTREKRQSCSHCVGDSMDL